MKRPAPVVIEFIEGSHLEVTSECQVVFSDGGNIQLPAAQIVSQENTDSGVRIGLDGMSFEGIHDEKLVFWHVYDIDRQFDFSPNNPIRVMIEPSRVGKVLIRGLPVWPQKDN